MVQRHWRKYVYRLGLGVVSLIALLCAASGGYVWWTLRGSLPQLEGTATLPDLTAPVVIVRDSAGVPTLTAQTRYDLARATGFIHGQERFFQMDLMRRAGAGELSELVGPAALEIDKSHRQHRFRARAAAAWAAMSTEARETLDAYVSGVNAGLAALRRPPFEYALLRQTPVKWTVIDSMLVVYNMYFALQNYNGWLNRRQALAEANLGSELAAFLYPAGTRADAAIDGSTIPEPPLPVRLPPMLSVPLTLPKLQPPASGSNSFAVAGWLTSNGSALVANDMHLDLGIPNTWYRARLIIRDAEDLIGITLPGLPYLVAGSNGHVAWGLTAAYIATGDVVVLEQDGGDAAIYRTPNGRRNLQTIHEQICSANLTCFDLPVEESIWGPVVADDQNGQKLVWRWTAHDPNAVRFDGILALERARNVREALDASHQVGLPQLNLLVADSAGNIGWTILGQIPKRFGLPDNIPHSWAGGSCGWRGYLTPNEIPEVVNPRSGRLWSANNRTIGGSGFLRLGDGGYYSGDRARQIRDALFERRLFHERDLLEIQLDIRAKALSPWQRLMVAALERHQSSSRLTEILNQVRNWHAAATVDSVGYRLVRDFADTAQQVLYGLYDASIQSAAGKTVEPLISTRASGPILRLLTERPVALVPPPYKSWEQIEAMILDRVAEKISEAVANHVENYTWGAANHANIHHPLAPPVPLLGRLTNPPDYSLPGDRDLPRVQRPGFGASERLVVSPSHEEHGLFAMPGGQAGNPLSEYYLKGHEDWAAGRAVPLLPGASKWRLILGPT